MDRGHWGQIRSQLIPRFENSHGHRLHRSARIACRTGGDREAGEESAIRQYAYRGGDADSLGKGARASRLLNLVTAIWWASWENCSLSTSAARIRWLLRLGNRVHSTENRMECLSARDKQDCKLQHLVSQNSRFMTNQVLRLRDVATRCGIAAKPWT
jgi:hypothetical protein